MKRALRTLSITVVAILALGVAACGSPGSQPEPPPTTHGPAGNADAPAGGPGIHAGGGSPAIAYVPVTIGAIGVTSVTPRGSTKTPEGGFAYQSAEFGFGKIALSLTSSPEDDGFTLLDQRPAGGREWSMYQAEADELSIRLAVTEIGEIAYYVELHASPTLIEEYVESVLLPALDAFSVDEIADTHVVPPNSDLQELLEALVAGSDLPALGVTVFDGERIIEASIIGVRRSGDPTPVEATDLFHIGSNTKAMTATLVATYVDEGVISWETTVEDIVGDEMSDLDDGLAQVTLRKLLSHTSGLDDEKAFAALSGIDDGVPVTEQRLEVATITLAQPAHHPAGEYMYSNVGYTIVGAMLEEITGASWEELIEARVFEVLGMDSCGFYAPGTPGEVDQPWGHADEREGQPLDPGDREADLPKAIAPAGLVHCNMSDWAIFLQSQLRGFQGSDTELISPDAFVALQTPADGSDYALGWGTIDAPNGLVLTHNGSNHRFTSEAWLVPGEDLGVLVVTNLGVEMASPTISRVVETMLVRHIAPDAG